jgi:hypothetical protein
LKRRRKTAAAAAAAVLVLVLLTVMAWVVAVAVVVVAEETTIFFDLKLAPSNRHAKEYCHRRCRRCLRRHRHQLTLWSVLTGQQQWRRRWCTLMKRV